VRGRCALHDALTIVQRAKHEYALLEHTLLIAYVRKRWNDRAAAGGDDEGVVWLREPIRCFHPLRVHINLFDTPACMKRDAFGGIPRRGIDENVVRLVRARQDAREQNAVVIAARLVAEHHDIETIRAAAREEIVHHPGAGHPISDNDKALFTHRCRFVRRRP
jgi:hypothetical protein